MDVKIGVMKSEPFVPLTTAILESLIHILFLFHHELFLLGKFAQP